MPEHPVRTHLVRTLLGVASVRLERTSLDLGERGGFEARWAAAYTGDADYTGDYDENEVLGLEAYREVVKIYLAELYRHRHGRAPGTVALNLASHQLLDDLGGWAKLNARPG